MAENENEGCMKILRKIQASEIKKDDRGKAKSFRICSLARPYMRGFHTSWFCFFIAFTAWFGIQPLIPTIRREFGLSKVMVAHSGTASISATILVRIIVGPLCDKFGPRRVMSGLLIAGSIPFACAGLITNGIGLIIVRLCIGILGGAFIPCQFWTSSMFNVKIVGTANALVGGWGNLGGGFTFILMPALFELVKTCGVGEFLAWKIAVIIPAVIVFVFGLIILWTSDDCPQGHWSNREKLPTIESNGKTDGVPNTAFSLDGEKDVTDKTGDKAMVEGVVNKPGVKAMVEDAELASTGFSIWLYVTVFVLVVQYGLCFGVEIAVNTVMNLYFLYAFKVENCTEGVVESLAANTTNMTSTMPTNTVNPDLNQCSILSQNSASLIASLFGLMNLFARALGGLLSDVLRKYFSIPGRLLSQFICLALEGVMLIIFSLMKDIPAAVVVMVCFSLFVQMSEGSTFAIVPYVHPARVGMISGLIGAGGNTGALIWNTIWSQMVDNNPSQWFFTLGICVLGGSILTLLIPVQNKRIWNLRRQTGTTYTVHELDNI